MEFFGNNMNGGLRGVHKKLIELISRADDTSELTHLLENKLEHGITDAQLYHALQKAAKDGNSQVADILLQNGAPITEYHIKTKRDLKVRGQVLHPWLRHYPDPMVGAISSGSPDILFSLISRGSNVNQTYNNQTLIMKSVLWNKPQCLSVLIEHGADIHQRCIDARPMIRNHNVIEDDESMNTQFLHMEKLGLGPQTPTNAAAYLGHLEVLKVCIMMGQMYNSVH